MHKESPRNIAINTLQALSSETTWSEIVSALQQSWVAETIPAELFQQAVNVFGDEPRAIRWLTSPSRALEGEIPAELAGKDNGQQLIIDELGRIEYGVIF